MVKIVNMGMNHESAPLELRECLAKEPENVGRALGFIRESKYFYEGLFLSTCNRVEALYTTDSPDNALEAMLTIMSDLGKLPKEELFPNIYVFEDREAVRHVFRVASSLDSLVVGEPQILGQIKDAYSQAVNKGKTSGVIINRIMHRAFHVAKRIRSETGISEAAVSVSYAAVELAKKIFYDLENKTVLLVGAGEMAELAARHLMGHGIKTLIVANRSFDRAVQVAKSFNAVPVFFEEVEEQLLKADIVITSTGSTEYIIKSGSIKKIMPKRKNRPLFFIDIAVPRDVEPAINKLGNIYLYDMDDLKEVVEENSTQRKKEAIKGERIIKEEVLKFEQWIKTLEVVPTIKSLKKKTEAIRKSEIEKTLSNLGEITPAQVKSIENLTISLMEKIINDPILTLKGKAERGTRDMYINIVRNLFKLDQENKNGNKK